MKKLIKILFIFIIVIVMFANIINAVDDPVALMDKSKWETGNDTLIAPTLNVVLGIVQVVAIGVLVVSVVILAIRYMVSSVNEKATIKQQMIPIIIGSALIFGSVSLVRLVQTFTTESLK